jgi:hypothetical protein
MTAVFTCIKVQACCGLLRITLENVFLSNNWLTREAARLESEYTMCDPNKIIDCLNELSHKDINKQTDYVNIWYVSCGDYHANLFDDFEEWLSSILGAH